MSERRTYAFVCPECATAITVDGATKAAIFEHGCAICGIATPPDAFASV